MNNWKLIALWSLLGSMSIAAPAMSSTLQVTGLDQGDYTQNDVNSVTTTINAAITSVNVDLVADVANNVCKLQNIVTADRLASAAQWQPIQSPLTGYYWLDSVGNLNVDLEFTIGNLSADGSLYAQPAPISANASMFYNYQGNSGTTLGTGIIYSVMDFQNDADFNSCFPGLASSSPSSSSSATATAATTSVTSDVFRRTTSTLLGNSRMMDIAITRFINESSLGPNNAITRDNVTGPLGLQITGLNLDADDDGGFLFVSVSWPPPSQFLSELRVRV